MSWPGGSETDSDSHKSDALGWVTEGCDWAPVCSPSLLVASGGQASHMVTPVILRQVLQQTKGQSCGLLYPNIYRSENTTRLLPSCDMSPRSH